MHRSLIILGTALAGLVSQAYAYDGTLTINGNVSAESCTISVAGGASSGSITLPTVSTKALAVAAATAGTTDFSISLTACSGASTQAAIWFEYDSNVNAAGRLINTGTARNVDVALYNLSSTTPIAVGQGSGAFGSSGAAFPISSGTATLRYQAKYYATGVAVAGTVTASVYYTVQYQ
ncbi:fimbrial protein [Aquitalea sp. ASV15]|uniref:fimbrial protein n=1 Tax=Aquitalea sp. ASV15 TaxID=2795104 RepID=UPI0018EBCA35|nr:fimbrial protein [Aquitalea sp. ASV15]